MYSFSFVSFDLFDISLIDWIFLLFIYLARKMELDKDMTCRIWNQKATSMHDIQSQLIDTNSNIELNNSDSDNDNDINIDETDSPKIDSKNGKKKKKNFITHIF